MYNLEIINRVGGATSIRIHESYINSTLSFNPLNSKVSLSKSSISPFPINFKREETIRLSKEEIHISKNRGVAVSHSWGGGARNLHFDEDFRSDFRPEMQRNLQSHEFHRFDMEPLDSVYRKRVCDIESATETGLSLSLLRERARRAKRGRVALLRERDGGIYRREEEREREAEKERRRERGRVIGKWRWPLSSLRSRPRGQTE